MIDYFRPLAQIGPARPDSALPLAGGWTWFTHAEHITRAGSQGIFAAADLPADLLARLTAARAPIAGLSMNRPQLMGILNVTPGSFSDGGQFLAPEAAISHARGMVADGAAMLDIGGESTRPGAAEVPVEEEISRTAPVISALTGAGIGVPISIDTRKAPVAGAALKAGAAMINDVAAFTFDPALAPLAAETGVPVCLMHAQGTPEHMQDNPRYGDVLLEVYDALQAYVTQAEAAGIPRSRIAVDPGIGFGKTTDHNLALLAGISLFHGLGCPILLGASRKRFIGVIGNEQDAAARMPGSVAVALGAAAQGVQLLRVHDMKETRQALDLTEAVWGVT